MQDLHLSPFKFEWEYNAYGDIVNDDELIPTCKSKIRS